MPRISLQERLQLAGYKYTTPRRVVAEVLDAQHQHLSANEIWEQVQQLNPKVGRMSVYRTLELFTHLGLIRPTSQSAADARNGLVYVVLEDGHHHHIICQRCDQVIEFDDCGLEALIQRVESEYHCQIHSHLLELFGLCASCLASPASIALPTED